MYGHTMLSHMNAMWSDWSSRRVSPYKAKGHDVVPLGVPR